MNQETRVTTWHPDGIVAEWRSADSPPKAFDSAVYIVWAYGEHHIAWYEALDSGGYGWVSTHGYVIKGAKWWTYAPEPPEPPR